MKYLFLDIETTPIEINNEDVKQYLMDKKISKESRSMDPNYSKVIVIGVKLDNEFKLFTGEENLILKQFWDFINENKYVIIVTHNGYRFDIPFLIIRSAINNIIPTLNININPWQMLNSNHFDTMLFFSQNIFTNPGLKNLARLNNIEFEDNKIMGSDIERLYKEGKIDDINKHCQTDIEILEKLFNKTCRNYFENYKK